MGAPMIPCAHTRLFNTLKRQLGEIRTDTFSPYITVNDLRLEQTGAGYLRFVTTKCFPCCFYRLSFVVVLNAMEISGLYRNTLEGFSCANFEQNPFMYLWVNKLALSMAVDRIDYAFLCLEQPNCYSFQHGGIS